MKARPDLSITNRHSLHDNLIVRGDNLLALKALLPTLAGQVKCIYIDPPYNTGNEGWVYNDNVNSPMIKSWLGEVVDKDCGTRHDRWLCMMMPRLKLLHELLREDGVICVNLDDNEVSNCRVLLDEVFGEDNFLAVVTWEKRYTRSNNAKLFSSIKDSIIIYRKSDLVDKIREARTEKSNSIYTNPDNDERGPWTSVSYINPAPKDKRPNLVYEIENPFTKAKIEHPTNAWKYGKSTHDKHVKEKRLYWGESGNFQYPRLKKFLSEVSDGIVPTDMWRYDVAGTSDEGSKELEEILGRAIFDNPKPTKLIKKVISLFTEDNEEAIILDSFAGSGTTGHAVLELNYENDGNRRFVLVEMEDYAEKLTAERIRRVIQGVPDSRREELQNGLGGSFSYFELGEEVQEGALLEESVLPTYEELARHLFFTATGEQLDPATVVKEKHHVGESARQVVWLWYEQDAEWLKHRGFTVEDALQLPEPPQGKRNVVFGPMKFMGDDILQDVIPLRKKKIQFLQLPYEIYRMAQ